VIHVNGLPNIVVVIYSKLHFGGKPDPTFPLPSPSHNSFVLEFIIYQNNTNFFYI